MKGQLFSVTSVLLLAVIIVYFTVHEQAINDQQQFRIQRAQLMNLNTFVNMFAEQDIPNMLQSASRLALESRSQQQPYIAITNAEFNSILHTGSANGAQYLAAQYTLDTQFQMALSALSFSQNEPMLFNFSLDSVQQTSNNSLTLHFLVNYSISSENNTWSATDTPYSVEVPVLGLTHPTYKLRIDEHWVPTGGCFATVLFASATPCGFNTAPPFPLPS